MKRIIAPALAALALAGVACSLGNSSWNVKAAANANGWDYDSLNPTTNEGASYFKSCWNNENQLTSARLSEQASLFYAVPTYGGRGEHKDLFDLTTLEFTVEMSHMSNLLLVTMASSSGGYYVAGNNGLLTMDILPAKKNTVDGTNNLYMVTLSAADDNHNVSIDGWSDGGKWADDSAFTGVQVTAADNKINVKFEKISSESTNVTVNEVTKTVKNSDLYALYDKKGRAYNEPSYFVVGGMNGAGKEKVIFEKVTDKAHDEYYSSTGAYGKAKTLIADLKDDPVTTVSEAQNFLAKYNGLDMASVKSYDQAWMNEDYQTVLTKVATAQSLDPTYTLKLKVADMDSATVSISTAEDISTAEAAIAFVKSAYDALDLENLDSVSKEYADTVPGLISAAKAKVASAATPLYIAAVTSYVNAVDAIDDADTLLAAKAAYSAIPFNYESYFTEEALAVETARLKAAKDKYESLVRISSDSVTQGNGVDVLTLDNGELLAVSNGGCNYDNKGVGNGLYFNQELDYMNFEIKLNISKLDMDNTWMSFGIMENKNMFKNAEDDSVTENKGVFFLVSRDSTATLSVQVFVCTMSATRFYDSKLITVATIPFAEDVTLSMKNVTKEVGGLVGNYYSIRFNNVEYDELITANKMKTVFPNGKNCYFYSCSSGSQVVYTIKTINGKSPLSASLMPDSLVPTTTDTALTYTLASNEDLKINVDTKGQTISSLKVGKKVVGTQNYTYENGVLTIKAAALAKVAEGAQKVTMETAFGSLTWDLSVVTAGGETASSSETTSNPGSEASSDQGGSSSKGCGGSVAATSAIVATLSLAGAGLVLLKKKQDK